MAFAWSWCSIWKLEVIRKSQIPNPKSKNPNPKTDLVLATKVTKKTKITKSYFVS